MNNERKLNIFEKYLTVWVLVCIGIGIILGKLAPNIAVKLYSGGYVYVQNLL